MRIDYLAFSAHKVYAPFGTGVLVVRKGLLDFGPAELELIQSSGEENAGGIAALGKALVAFAADRPGLDPRGRTGFEPGGHCAAGANTGPHDFTGSRTRTRPRFAQKGGVIAFDLKGILSGPVPKSWPSGAGIGCDTVPLRAPTDKASCSTSIHC